MNPKLDSPAQHTHRVAQSFGQSVDYPDRIAAGSFDFGTALTLLKQGKLVGRADWHGIGVHVQLAKGQFDGAKLGYEPGEQPIPDHPSTICGVRISFFFAAEPGTEVLMPHFVMRSGGALGAATEVGWSPTAIDILAHDWGHVVMKELAPEPVDDTAHIEVPDGAEGASA